MPWRWLRTAVVRLSAGVVYWAITNIMHHWVWLVASLAGMQDRPVSLHKSMHVAGRYD